MGTILFNNNNNEGHSQEQKNTVNESKPASQELQKTAMEDEFAIFPEWSVVPPNSIINPRIKRKI